MKKFILGILVVLLVLFVARDFIIKSCVELGVGVVTGFPLKIGSLKTDILKNKIEIRDLKMMNPSGYEEPVMLDMPEILVQSDFGALLFKGNIHVPELRVDLQQFNVVKNGKGELNLDRLKALQPPPSKKKETAAPTKPQKTPALQVDSLTLKVGKVTLKDFTKIPAATNEFNINLNEHYENIEHLNVIISLIVAKALMYTTIGQLTNFDTKGLENSVSGSMSASKEKLAAASAKTTEAAKAKASEAEGWLASKTKALKEKMGAN